jgi:hypothetical protein
MNTRRGGGRSRDMTHSIPAPGPRLFGVVGVIVRLAVAGREGTRDRQGPLRHGCIAAPSVLGAAVKAAIDARLAPLTGQVLLELAPIVTALGAVAPAEPDLGQGQGVVGCRGRQVRRQRRLSSRSWGPHRTGACSSMRTMSPIC